MVETSLDLTNYPPNSYMTHGVGAKTVPFEELIEWALKIDKTRSIDEKYEKCLNYLASIVDSLAVNWENRYEMYQLIGHRERSFTLPAEGTLDVYRGGHRVSGSFSGVVMEMRVLGWLTEAKRYGRVSYGGNIL